MNEIREELVVDAGEEGIRLDRWLTDSLQEMDYPISRAQVQEFIAEGQVSGERPTLRSSDGVKAGEQYRVFVPAAKPLELEADKIPLDISYEDTDVIVVNKPRGVVVHPAAGHPNGTLINGLVYLGVPLSHLGGETRPGVVHRIDKDTSGLVVFAKSDAAYLSLAAQLREHSMERRYRAIVHGRIAHDEGTVDAPIGRDPKNRQRMAVVEQGKPSVTHFRVLERFSNYSYLEMKLETGRTHQIRVHMSYIGYPLVGDPLYGPRRSVDGFSGQALHALSLGFQHPTTGEWLSFQADLPQDMQDLLLWIEERET